MSDLSRQSYIERARILLKQKRYKDAEQHAAMVLRDNPNDADALQIIGHCRLDNQQHAEAIAIFKQCLGIEPDDDYVHYLLAFAYYRNKAKDEAIGYLQSALRLNPYSSGYYGLYAYVLIEEAKYAEALEKANEGLYVNAQDLTCLNARTQSLFRLKNKEAAYNTIKEALTVDPEDDFTHTNFAWHFMELGKHKKAREHFREALRINPNNARARQGYKESLKANLLPYRWMLMFSLWLSAKSKKARWAIVIVILLSVQLTSGVSDNAGFGILAYVLMGLYVAFVVFSWVGTSIANGMLLLSREGKFVLTKSERYISAGVVICLLAALALAISEMRLPATKDDHQFFPALIFLVLTLPLSRLEYVEILKVHRYALLFTILLIGFGLVCGICSVFLGGKPIYYTDLAYFAALGVYTWTFSFTTA